MPNAPMLYCGMDNTERNRLIVERALAGESYRAIAESLGMNAHHVSGIGLHNGVPRRNPSRTGRTRKARVTNGHGYLLVHIPSHPRADPSTGYVWEHVVVVERALGHYLPRTAAVHHVNGDKQDNRPGNLVVCHDRAYHFLLHQRQRALKMCGNANWLACRFCHRHDDPANLTLEKKRRAGWHKTCANAYTRKDAILARRVRLHAQRTAGVVVPN